MPRLASSPDQPPQMGGPDEDRTQELGGSHTCTCAGRWRHEPRTCQHQPQRAGAARGARNDMREPKRFRHAWKRGQRAVTVQLQRAIRDCLRRQSRNGVTGQLKQSARGVAVRHRLLPSRLALAARSLSLPARAGMSPRREPTCARATTSKLCAFVPRGGRKLPRFAAWGAPADARLRPAHRQEVQRLIQIIRPQGEVAR